MSEFVAALEMVRARLGTPLYPPIEPYNKGMLPVSERHTLYYEEVGNKDSEEIVIVFHGGPGGGCGEAMRQFFNPQKFRVVLYDQRGAGRSLPFADCEENNTFLLVEDVLKLRKHLGIEGKTWCFGGSWGSTHALTYAICHPTLVKGLCLRGIFLVNEAELRFLYQFGANQIYPDAYEASRYADEIPKEERGDFITAYHKYLFGDDEAKKLACAKSWSMWEGMTSYAVGRPIEETAKKFAAPEFCLPFARIENHYFYNSLRHAEGFFPTDTWILDNVDKIKDIPISITHGRMDAVCVFASAYALRKRLAEVGAKHVDFIECPFSGHSANEPDIQASLVRAMDKFAGLGK